MIKIGNQMQHFPLLALPRELRDIVYGHVYTPTDVMVRMKSHKRSTIRAYRAMPPRLGAVCWQLRLETRHYQSKGHHDWHHRLALERELHEYVQKLPKGFLFFGQALCTDSSSSLMHIRVCLAETGASVYAEFANI